MVEPHDEYCAGAGPVFEVDSAFWDFGDGLAGWVQPNIIEGEFIPEWALVGLTDVQAHEVTGFGRFGIPHPKTRFAAEAFGYSTASQDAGSLYEQTSFLPPDFLGDPAVSHYVWALIIRNPDDPEDFYFDPRGPMYPNPAVLPVRVPPGL